MKRARLYQNKMPENFYAIFIILNSLILEYLPVGLIIDRLFRNKFYATERASEKF